MRKINVETDTLQEWYDILIRKKTALVESKNRKFHLPMYHQQIRSIIKECDSYTEFGVFQGHTLAVALLMNPKKVRAHDIDLNSFSHSRHLFDNYAKENKIDFKVHQGDTSTCLVIDETDILNIDSLHTYEHCTKELDRHSHRVKKYIIFHDTTNPNLFKAINKFILLNDWELVTRNEKGVGYTLLKRK